MPAMRRLLIPLLLLLPLTACLPKVPPAPPVIAGIVWEVERDSVPPGTLRVMHVATTGARERIVVQGGGGDRLDLPVYVYVYEHPIHGTVLIDTGFGRRTAADTADYPGTRATNLLSLVMGTPAADQLKDIGKDVGDVKNVVVTHMHADHIGGIEDFPNAALWVARSEWESADERTALGKPDTSPFANHAAVKLVEFTGTQPYGPFPGHVDLFDDGSVILIPAAGHTPGHVAVMVNLPSGSFLFTGDCAWIDRHWTGPELKSSLVRSLLEDDWERNWSNQWRIHEWAAAYPELTVVAGHEPANLTKLKAWPEAYE